MTDIEYSVALMEYEDGKAAGRPRLLESSEDQEIVNFVRRWFYRKKLEQIKELEE